MAFNRFTPEPDGIYDCISPSLLDEAHFNTWLNESQHPINFTCITCGKSTIDLTKLEFMGGIHPRISVSKLRKPIFQPTQPWTIACEHCNSIFQILNGWTEPNNGRMIILLGHIYQLELNSKYEKRLIFSLPVVNEPVRRLYHLPKSYKKITFTKGEMKFSMYLENLIGRFHETHKRNMEIFSDQEQNELIGRTLRMISRAIRFNLKNLFRQQASIIQSHAWLVTEIELSENGKVIIDYADLDGSISGEIETMLIALFEAIFEAVDQPSNAILLNDPALSLMELIEER